MIIQRVSRLSKSTRVGVIAGIGVAVAGAAAALLRLWARPAGALIGREIQEEIQENRAEQRTVTTAERRCAPITFR
jgi:uncharacterized protein YcfJ